MFKRACTALLLGTLIAPPWALAAGAPPTPRVAVDYRAAYPANFLWLVNALAGDPHASTAAFRAYWRSAGYARPGDDGQLATYRRIRGRYEGDYLRPEKEVASLVPLSPAGGDLRQKFFSLFFSSARMDEVWAKAEVLMADADREELARVFAHFQPAFDAHWKTNGHLEAYRAKFQAFAEARKLPALLGEAAGFLGVPAEADLRVRVIFLFTPEAKHTFGRAVGPNLVVEIPAGQTPEHQADVVVHELCHYFYDRGGVEQDAGFMKGLFGSGDRHAGPTWALLNEGLATAIGQGVAVERLVPASFTRTRAKPLGWYQDARIDAFAKAIYPAVNAAMRAGKTYRALGPDLLTAYARALGDADDDPKTYLASYILIDGFPRRQGFVRFFERVTPRSVWHSRLGSARNTLEAFPAQTVLVAATAADLPRIREEIGAYQVTAAQLDALARQERALLVLRRPANGYLFLVYGRDAAALDEAMAHFGALARFGEGLQPL